MPDVSVVIPVHNGALYIERAVRSVLNQTWADLEVIVVDDASVDDTGAIVARQAREDARANVITSPVNNGPAASRNLGIAAARGRWIAILDADDWYAPHRLEHLLCLGESAYADAVCDDLMLIEQADGKTIGPMFGTDRLPPVLDGASFVAASMPDPERPRRGSGFLKPILRQAFLSRHGLAYDEKMRFSEDYAFYLSVLLAGARWITSPEPTYFYAVRGDSLTARHDGQDLMRLCAVDRAALAMADDVSFERALRRHLISTEKRAAWARFVELYKRRQVSALLQTATDSGHVLAHIVAQCFLQLIQRIARQPSGPNRARREPEPDTLDVRPNSRNQGIELSPHGSHSGTSGRRPR
jgi:glycosyltransferase involved in cell wall biosynthesis